MLPEIMGYRRPDGRFGIRNHIAVIATMDNANPTVRRICSLVKGCVPFCPGFGRGEMNEDLALHNLLSINTALHPNVYGVIVVALEDQTAEYITGEIAKGGKPVVGFSIEDQGGTVEVAYRAAQAAIQMLHDAGRLRPEPMPWSEFVWPTASSTPEAPSSCRKRWNCWAARRCSAAVPSPPKWPPR